MIELKAHCRGSHGLYLCDLCAEHRNVFVSELELYNKNDLNKHLSKHHSLHDRLHNT